jgi:hypothetical protein
MGIWLAAYMVLERSCRLWCYSSLAEWLTANSLCLLSQSIPVNGARIPNVPQLLVFLQLSHALLHSC